MNGTRILVIDDESDICFLLGNMLKQKDYEVKQANRLSEGFAMLKEFAPHILFLDIHLPDGSGLDSIKKIKENFPGTKIIIMSAYDGIKERNLAFQEGANAFISKPLNFGAINESLNKVNVLS